MAESPVVQLRVPEATLALIDEARGEQPRSGWFLALAEREFDDIGPDQPVANGLMPGLPVTCEVPPGGIGSPGVACSWPECWVRDTRRYGVTDAAELTRGSYLERPRDPEKCGISLCRAHASKLNGFRYIRPQAAPRSAARTPEPA